jgi:hypothetical protein
MAPPQAKTKSQSNLFREKTSSLNNQPVQTVQINQPVHTEPINQPVQAEKNIQTPSETIQPFVGKETNKRTINPAGQDQNPPLTGKQSPLSGQFNPTGLSPTQWERQKSLFTDLLGGYTSPGGSHVNIQNLMMLAFTQNQHEGNNQYNIMAQSQLHINIMAQQQKELLGKQAAAIQEGTDKVLAAQNALILGMQTKLKEDNSRVKELLARLTDLELALKVEKIKSMEFQRNLLVERQHKRRALHSPEEAPGERKVRTMGHSLFTNPPSTVINSTPSDDNASSAKDSTRNDSTHKLFNTSLSSAPPRICQITGHSTAELSNMSSSSAYIPYTSRITGPPMSASGLPISKKFNLISSVRSIDRQPSQHMIDARSQPPPIPAIQQIQPAAQQTQPTLQQMPPAIRQTHTAVQPP